MPSPLTVSHPYHMHTLCSHFVVAYSATLSRMRNLITQEEHNQLLTLFSRAGLSMDHAQFDYALLEKATAAILKTRDGKLRAAVPVSPMGSCVFLNDVTHEEMCRALDLHKIIMAEYPRGGEGVEAYVDASDTGYTLQDKKSEHGVNKHNSGMNGSAARRKSSGYAEGMGRIQSGLKEAASGLDSAILNVTAAVEGIGRS